MEKIKLSNVLGFSINSEDKSNYHSNVKNLPNKESYNESIPSIEGHSQHTAGVSKFASGSRGTSPASKKRQLGEGSCSVSANTRKKSPLVNRKVLAAEAFHAIPPTGKNYSLNHEETVTHGDDENEAAVGMSVDAADTSGEVDEADGTVSFTSIPNQVQKTREMVDHLELKVQKIAELIKEEQKARDENVDEYLKLAGNANKQQAPRIKAVFEKKNQKSAAAIQQLQKKLDSYQRKLRDIDVYGPNSTQRQPKDVLRDMGHGLKRSMLISKPKEIAHMLKNKFGSADNIKELEDKDEEKNHHGSATLPPNSGLHPTPTSGIASSNQIGSNTTAIGSSGGAGSGAGGGGSSAGDKGASDDASECSSSLLSESYAHGAAHQQIVYPSPRNQHTGLSIDITESNNQFDMFMQEMALRQEENNQIKEDIDSVKQTVTQEVFQWRQSMAEERYRLERLEEQINDLTELHQNEMENLKMAITDMEEKVQYQSEERIRDLHEVVENCQTRISRMEHQQAQQQQQFLTLEGLENSNARAVVVKLINILLTILQVLLLIVAAVAGILTPLLQTRTRLLTSLACCLFVFFVYVQLHEVKEIGYNLYTKAAYKSRLFS